MIAPALKQLGLYWVLQFMNVLGYCRLGNKKFGSCFGKTQPLGNGIKNFQPEIGHAANIRLCIHKLSAFAYLSVIIQWKNLPFFGVLFGLGCAHRPQSIHVKVSLTTTNVHWRSVVSIWQLLLILAGIPATKPGRAYSQFTKCLLIAIWRIISMFSREIIR